MSPTVTYTGMEVVLVTAMIAGSLPDLDQDDYEIADLMLDKAMASLPQPLAPDLEAKIARLRTRPNQQEIIFEPSTPRGRLRSGWLRRLLGGWQHRS